MKYGETLRQRSIPQWSHHNIDYDEIKHYIKEQTTHGRGKSVAIPGRGDEKLKCFENTLFGILVEQHARIDLFVKSKVGEIQRRLDHAERQLDQLKSKSYATDRRIPVRRLERYSRLENDVLKAGEEIKSLSRFVGAQRTALRKLVKKYKKWTGSRELEDRFNHEVLSDPKTFTNIDLGPLLNDYSETLLSIRSLYESGTKLPIIPHSADDGQAGSANVTQLHSKLASGSKKDFDKAFVEIPVSKRGIIATYFVHPDNVVELTVLLLEHCQYLTSSRKGSSAVQETPRTRNGSSLIDYNEGGICCSRSRLTGLRNSSTDVVLTSLDENLTDGTYDLPFCVLRVRQEGSAVCTLVNILDKSHLVERVHTFPLSYRSVFESCKSTDSTKPAWHCTLSRDIRKLPPPAVNGSDTIPTDGPGESSTTQASTSSGSLASYTASLAATEEVRTPNILAELDKPPLRSFRKKRRRGYRETPISESLPKYWSEYDHPEDGEDAGAYVIYIDPNEKSMLDKFLDSLGGVFTSRLSISNNRLLDGSSTPATERDDESSSDEEAAIGRTAKRTKSKSYGTIHRPHAAATPYDQYGPTHTLKQRLMPQITAICMFASFAIQVVAYILATTGKHKYAREVDAGVIFAIASSLILAICGVASMLGRSDLAWSAWAMGIGLLIVDAVCSGGLLAWMLG